MLGIYDLKIEYKSNPNCVDNRKPRFSWKLKSDCSEVIQKNYRILAEVDGKVIWDSGVVESSQSQRIHYKGETLKSRQTVKWRVWVTAADGEGVLEEAISETAEFKMGLLNREDWLARWIEPEDKIAPDQDKPAPYLRREFLVRPGLKEARIYQTAHGLYEAWMNGKLCTEEKFKPGLTSYYYRIQYQTNDVTRLLQEGKNCWSVELGDGWWRGITGGSVKNNFGFKLHYLGQLELYYEDGSSEIIKSDREFRTATGGLLSSDMMMGDIYDARLEPEGWKEVGFDDSNWKKVHVIGGVHAGGYDNVGKCLYPGVDSDAPCHVDAELIASRSVPVREKEVFEAKLFRDAAGKMILDFGQNIAGYVKMRLHDTQEGQQIHLVHGEDINAEGCFSVEHINKPVMPVPRFQEITYICRGGDIEEYVPLFAVFGFRYLMVEGYEGEILPGDFLAKAVYSDMEESGDFTCSHPLINKLVQNSRWSQKGNFLDVAVDCPTRERNAWTGDNQIYVRTAGLFMNVYPFYEKWLQDQAIEQYASGKVGITFPSTSSVHNPEILEEALKTNPTFALAGPTGNGNMGEDCAGWGDSAAWIPYMIYLCYGDVQILENQYETARRWVDYMLQCAKDHNPLYEDQPQYHTYTDGELDADYIYDTRMHYGEWQEPIAAPIPEGVNLQEVFERMVKEGKPKVATAYMCRSAENVSMMARVLGRNEDGEKYEQIAHRIRQVYDTYFISSNGQLEPGHQAAYVRALAFGLCSEEKRPLVQEQLVKEIEQNGYKLNTGFLSTPFLLPVLVEMGRTDLAYRILEQTENPSWLHPITLGATTIPESWSGFDNHAGSLNHYSYGAVCEFLFGYVGGIRPTWEKPGYEEFVVRPIPGGSLTYARAEYESQYGRIESAWKKEKDKIIFEVTVPANTRAIICLPDGSERKKGSGKYRYVIPQDFQKTC